MFNSDKPIENASQDLLSRDEFAKRFSKALLGYEDISGLCIGLFGAWGSGKTSLLNLIIHEIGSRAVDMSEDEKPVIMRFDPWNYTSTQQLVHQYFVMLSSRFSESGDKHLVSLGAQIEKYGDALSESTRAFARGNKEIEAYRLAIVNSIRDQKKKIIITIDDIDRLTDEEMRVIFQLVASVADFPNTIFLLAFDKDVVMKSLKNFHDDSGQYLEKIIQVGVEVPAITDPQLMDVFANYFDPFLREYDNLIFAEPYWKQMSRYIFPQLRNVRDIVRLSNSIQLKLGMIGDRINFTDLMLVTLMEQKAPALYEWIRGHGEELTQSRGYETQTQTPQVSANEQLRMKFSTEFRTLGLQMTADECHELLSQMFPVYGRALNGASSEYDLDELKKNERIGHPDVFSRYFVMNFGDSKIPRRTVSDALYTYPLNELKEFIRDSVKTFRPSDLITETDSIADELPFERRRILAQALISDVKYFDDSLSGDNIFSAKERAIYLIIVLMAKLGTDTSYLLMQDAINTADDGDVDTISRLLKIMLNSYDHTKKEQSYPRVVTEDQLTKLTNRFAETQKNK